MQATETVTPPRTEPLPGTDAITSRERLSPRDYVLVLVQLALLVVLVWQFHLEERRRLLACMAVASGGFAVHALLPRRQRLAAFLLLSIGGVVLVLGPLQAAYALGVGALLIGVTFLPIALRWRVALIALLAAGLVWLRSESSDAFWPIVGSMFMFRMIVYLHATGRERRPASPLQACSYFFLLPNAFFPLFPVIDYRTFRDSYFNAERRTIYQTGVHWMAIGIAHLLLYRLIKYELLPTPLEVRSLRGVALFLAANYGLYLRVSGQFHLVCGVLHLFGFHLPRTHDWYFLASSFSDIWRRINIYWKDFMQRVVLFPAFFRLRAVGDGPGIVLAVLCVFLCTWVAHSWQAFWLLGDFPLRRGDALMWLAVGAVVAGSAVLDYRRAARVREAGRSVASAFSVTRASVRVLKIVGVFACVSLFWARWTNPEVFRFLLATVRRTVQPQDVLRIAAALAAAVAVGVAVQFLLQRSKARRQDTFSSLERRPFTARSVAFERSVALHLVPMILVLLTVQPEVHTLFGRSASELLARLKTDQPAGAEALAAVEGYYERLQCLQSGPWLNSPAPDPSRQTAAAEYEALTRPADLLLEVELIPGAEGTLDGSPISINQWGMRDRRTITLSKPRGTTRIALVGSSVVMGYGVADEDVFGRLLEAKLNEGQSGRDGRYEVLNFAVGKHYAVHRRVLLDRKVLAFQPDAVFYFAHQEELYYPARQLAELVAKGAALPDACLREVLDRAGVTTDMAWGQIASLLGGRDEEILRCLYGSFARTCREHGAVPVWAYLPIPGVPDDPPDPSAALLKLAAESRFVVLDLSDWAEGYALTEIKAEADDQHPNAFGHQRISEALWGVLERNPGALPRGE